MTPAECNNNLWLTISPSYKGDLRISILQTRKRTWGLEANTPKATNLRNSTARIWTNQRMKRGNFWNCGNKMTFSIWKLQSLKTNFLRIWSILLRTNCCLLYGPWILKGLYRCEITVCIDKHMQKQNYLHLSFPAKDFKKRMNLDHFVFLDNSAF